MVYLSLQVFSRRASNGDKWEKEEGEVLPCSIIISVSSNSGREWIVIKLVSLWTSCNTLFQISTEKVRPLSTQFLFSKRDDGRIPCLGSVHSEWIWEDKLGPSICTTGHGLKEDLFDEGKTLNDTGSTCNMSQTSENSRPVMSKGILKVVWQLKAWLRTSSQRSLDLSWWGRMNWWRMKTRRILQPRFSNTGSLPTWFTRS